jgi:hypothetical protein
LQVDHLISRPDGGTNYPENLVAACRPCNVHKGSASLSIDLRETLSIDLRETDIFPPHYLRRWVPACRLADPDHPDRLSKACIAGIDTVLEEALAYLFGG